jgi:hypothetical protein
MIDAGSSRQTHCEGQSVPSGARCVGADGTPVGMLALLPRTYSGKQSSLEAAAAARKTPRYPASLSAPQSRAGAA